jgi:HEAT repeat protein
LFYSTLVIALAAAGYMEVMTLWTRIGEWHETRTLVALLRGMDPRGREMAAAELVRRGASVAVPHLLEAASDERGEVRALVCRSLVKMCADPSMVIPLLVAAAGEGQEQEVRQEAARCFGRVAVSARQTSRESPGAAGVLAPNLQSQSIEALGRLLKDRSISVRAAAADSLGAFKPDPTAAAALHAATGDEDRSVRLAAARALILNWGEDRSATRTLLAMVADPEAVPDREVVLETLKLAGAEVLDQAVAALAAMLPHGDSAVLPDVVACLAVLGPQARAALSALERLWKGEDPGLRTAAGQAITAIEGKESSRSVAIWVDMIADPMFTIDQRRAACESVVEVNPAALEQATPRLILQLSNVDVDIRSAAIEMLSMIVPTTPATMPDSTEGK